MELVVHIGSHKAGSTSIQSFCASQPAVLRAAGIHYPLGAFAENPGQHSSLKDLMIQGRLDEVRAFLAGAAQAARAEGAGTVFLSGEDLCSFGPGLAHLFQLQAAPVFRKTRVVLLLRNKRDYLYSSYKHYLLHGGTSSEHDFVTRQVFSPRRTVAAWRQIKGMGVQVLAFDAIKRDLLGSFFRSVFDLPVQAQIVANRSLDYLTLQAVNALLKPAGGGHTDRAALAELYRLSELHPPLPPLPVEDVVADGIDARFPNEDWEVPELDFVPALLERRVMAGQPVDPAAACARMAAMYSALQTYCNARA